jgi:hypothetical protein
MSIRTQFIVIAALVSLGSVSSVAAAPQAQKVTSTLDGKTVLGPQQHWIVTPHMAATNVKEVDFLIDNKLRGIERKAPFNYGGDDLHGHLGFLYTSWLSPGKHRFSAVVKTVTGPSASDTVIARVLPATPPPGTLAGTWTRTVTDADTTKATSGAPPPAGKWKLVIDSVGAWMLDPMGSGIVNADRINGSTLEILAPIQMAPFDNGKGGITRFGHHGIGGTACREDGPTDSFTWSVSANELTLTARTAPCGDNRAILEGTWTRVGG